MISEELVRQVTNQEETERVYKVDLCNRHIAQISGLNPFSKIRCLQLDFNKIRRIENLGCLPDLREIHLEYNEIERIEGLESNKMLTFISLANNRIQKIENVGHLIKLETLIVDKNCIEKISGLETLKDLKYVSMNENMLNTIDSLPAFSKLEVLSASHNKISKIPTTIFAKCTKLLKLHLSNNKLKDLTFVNCLSSLEELDLSMNSIANLELTGLENLEFLNVSGNSISNLPRLSGLLPQLETFLFADNQIISEYEIIQSLSDTEMLVEIDYRGNPMENPEFAETLYRIHELDRINGINYNKPGTRYLNQAHSINKVLKEEGMGEIENNEDVRKIVMSGFYDDQLEEDMTGVKPERPNSGRKRTSPLNLEEIEKNFSDILEKNNRLDQLRSECLHIFHENGIQIEPSTSYLQEISKDQEKSVLITENKNIINKTSSMNSITELSAKVEESATKWKELKNKEKSFNIRGAVRKSESQRKTSGIREGSLNKIQKNQEISELMKTQLNPPRWNNDPALMKTMQLRPLSAAKKKDK